MKRNIIIVFSMTVITILLLLLLGIFHVRTPGMQDFRTVATSAMDSSTMVPGDALKLRKAYGINVREAEDFVYFAPKSTMDASEIIIIKFKTEEEAQSALNAISAKISKLEGQFRNYKPDQADILKNSYLKNQGSYLIYISSKNSEAIKTQIEEIFK